MQDHPAHLREPLSTDALLKRSELLEGATRYLEDLEARRVGGLALNDLQKLAAIGFREWLRRHDANDALLGHVLMPMASGKTAVAAILGEMTERTTLFIADNATTASQALEFFTYHESLKSESDRLRVGRCFGPIRDVRAERIVGGFASANTWWDEIDWTKVGLIVIDEADVNALSEARYARVLQAASTGIPIVAMSATEQQASGKNLRAYFPQEILHEPVPGALRACLDAGIIAPTTFSDVYFDTTLTVEQGALHVRNDLSDERVRDFMRSTAWNALLLDDYERDFRRHDGTLEPALVIFRDNLLVDDFIQQATARGIRAAALTGEDDADEQRQVRERYRGGDIDVLVGSRLLGRGFNAPEARVVYNSTVTFSGQIFWQASGRALRRDPADPTKLAHVRTVLPGRVIDESTGQEVERARRPLSHATYFDPSYFAPDAPPSPRSGNRRRGWSRKRNGIQHFDLSHIETTRSIDEVESVLYPLWRHGSTFRGRPEFLASFVDSIQETALTRGFIWKILRMKNADLRDATLALRDEARPADDVCEQWSVNASLPSLTSKEERVLLLRYAAGRESQEVGIQNDALRARDSLLEAHMPLIIALARKFARGVDVQDLIQEGVIAFLAALNRFDLHYVGKSRLATYAFAGIADAMQRHASVLVMPYSIPDGVWQRRPGDAPAGIAQAEAVFRRAHVPMHTVVEPDETDPVTLGEQVPSGVDTPEELLLRRGLTHSVDEMLAAGSPQEEAVLRMRFGMNAEVRESTLREIAETIHLSRERIRQIGSRAERVVRGYVSSVPGLKSHLTDGTRGTIGTEWYVQQDLAQVRRSVQAKIRRGRIERIIEAAVNGIVNASDIKKLRKLGATPEDFVRFGDASTPLDANVAKVAYTAGRAADRLRTLAQLGLEQGLVHRAVRSLEAANEIDPISEPFALVEAYAEQLLWAAKFTRARRVYAALGRTIPAETARRVAILLLHSGDFSSAMKVYAYLREEPELADLLLCKERAGDMLQRATISRYLAAKRY